MRRGHVGNEQSGGGSRSPKGQEARSSADHPYERCLPRRAGHSNAEPKACRGQRNLLQREISCRDPSGRETWPVRSESGQERGGARPRMSEVPAATTGSSGSIERPACSAGGLAAATDGAMQNGYARWNAHSVHPSSARSWVVAAITLLISVRDSPALGCCSCAARTCSTLALSPLKMCAPWEAQCAAGATMPPHTKTCRSRTAICRRERPIGWQCAWHTCDTYQHTHIRAYKISIFSEGFSFVRQNRFGVHLIMGPHSVTSASTIRYTSPEVSSLSSFRVPVTVNGS